MQYLSPIAELNEQVEVKLKMSKAAALGLLAWMAVTSRSELVSGFAELTVRFPLDAAQQQALLEDMVNAVREGMAAANLKIDTTRGRLTYTRVVQSDFTQI